MNTQQGIYGADMVTTAEGWMCYLILLFSYSLPISMQLSVCGYIADLLAPSAGDAGDLQFSRPIAVGWTHPRRGVGPLPQPDKCQEKG